jgi:phage host-nuclease inhibitor protein Gam
MAEQQFTQEDLTALNQDSQSLDQMPMQGPEPKKKPAATPAPSLEVQQPKIGEIPGMVTAKTVKQVIPKEEEWKPSKVADLKGFELAAETFATFEKAERGGYTTPSVGIGGVPSMATGGMVFQSDSEGQKWLQGVKSQKAQAAVIKNQEIKKLSGVAEKITDNIFGSIDDIVKQGGRVKKYIDKNVSGQDIINPGKLNEAIDKAVEANGGGRYAKEFIRSQVRSKADLVLATYLERDNVNKITTGAITEEQQKKFYLDNTAKFEKQIKSQVKIQDDILGKKAEQIKQNYFQETTDIGVDMNFYWNAAQDEAAKSLEGITGIYGPAFQRSFEEKAKEIFDAKYAQYVMPKFEDMSFRLTSEIKQAVADANRAVKAIYKEGQIAFKGEMDKYAATVSEQNKQAAQEFSNKFSAIVNQRLKQRDDESKGYAQSMVDMSTMSGVLGSAITGKILGDTWTSAWGATKNKAALVLNSLGFEADFIDEMRYSGKSDEVKFGMEKASLGENWYKPGYLAQAITQSAPTMLAGMLVTGITKNPYIGGIIAFGSESVENSGGVMERVLEDTGDLDAARAAGAESFVKNAPTVISDVLMNRMFAPIKFAKGVVREKVKDFSINIASNMAEETWQAATDMSSGKGAKLGFVEALTTREALNAGIEGGLVATALGGASVTLSGTYKALFDPKNVPSIRTQAIAGQVVTNGSIAAMAGAQLDAIINEADDNTLKLGMQEVEDITKLVDDAKQIGLNPQQTQIFAAKSVELSELKAKLNTVTDPSIIKAIQAQIAAKEKEVAGIISGETPIATIELQPGLSFTSTVDGIKNIAAVPEVNEEIAAGNVRIITDDAGLNAEVEQVKTTARQRNIISDTGEVIGPVPMGEPTTEAPINQIKTTEDATQISERQQQEIPQPSNIVQREGAQEGQPQVGQAEGGIGQATQPAADTRNSPVSSQTQEALKDVESTAKALEDAREKLKEKYGVYLGGEFENHHTVSWNNKTEKWEIVSKSAKYNEEKGYREFEQKTIAESDAKNREDAIKELEAYAKEKGLTIYDGSNSLNTEATAFTKENREKFDAELAALQQAPAPTMEAAPVVEATPVSNILTADTRIPSNLENVFNFLDNIDKAISKELNSGKLNDATRVIPLATVQLMVKGLKALTKGGMTLQKALAKVAKKYKVSENDAMSALNIIANIESLGKDIVVMSARDYLKDSISNQINAIGKVKDRAKSIEDSIGKVIDDIKEKFGVDFKITSSGIKRLNKNLLDTVFSKMDDATAIDDIINKVTPVVEYEIKRSLLDKTNKLLNKVVSFSDKGKYTGNPGILIAENLYNLKSSNLLNSKATLEDIAILNEYLGEITKANINTSNIADAVSIVKQFLQAPKQIAKSSKDSALGTINNLLDKLNNGTIDFNDYKKLASLEKDINDLSKDIGEMEGLTDDEKNNLTSRFNQLLNSLPKPIEQLMEDVKENIDSDLSSNISRLKESVETSQEFRDSIENPYSFDELIGLKDALSEELNKYNQDKTKGFIGSLTPKDKILLSSTIDEAFRGNVNSTLYGFSSMIKEFNVFDKSYEFGTTISNKRERIGSPEASSFASTRVDNFRKIFVDIDYNKSSAKLIADGMAVFKIHSLDVQLNTGIVDEFGIGTLEKNVYAPISNASDKAFNLFSENLTTLEESKKLLNSKGNYPAIKNGIRRLNQTVGTGLFGKKTTLKYLKNLLGKDNTLYFDLSNRMVTIIANQIDHISNLEEGQEGIDVALARNILKIKPKDYKNREVKTFEQKYKNKPTAITDMTDAKEMFDTLAYGILTDGGTKTLDGLSTQELINLLPVDQQKVLAKWREHIDSNRYLSEAAMLRRGKKMAFLNSYMPRRVIKEAGEILDIEDYMKDIEAGIGVDSGQLKSRAGESGRLNLDGLSVLYNNLKDLYLINEVKPSLDGLKGIDKAVDKLNLENNLFASTYAQAVKLDISGRVKMALDSNERIVNDNLERVYKRIAGATSLAARILLIGNYRQIFKDYFSNILKLGPTLFFANKKAINQSYRLANPFSTVKYSTPNGTYVWDDYIDITAETGSPTYRTVTTRSDNFMYEFSKSKEQLQREQRLFSWQDMRPRKLAWMSKFEEAFLKITGEYLDHDSYKNKRGAYRAFYKTAVQRASDAADSLLDREQGLPSIIRQPLKMQLIPVFGRFLRNVSGGKLNTTISKNSPTALIFGFMAGFQSGINQLFSRHLRTALSVDKTITLEQRASEAAQALSKVIIPAIGYNLMGAIQGIAHATIENAVNSIGGGPEEKKEQYKKFNELEGWELQVEKMKTVFLKAEEKTMNTVLNSIFSSAIDANALGFIRPFAGLIAFKFWQEGKIEELNNKGLSKEQIEEAKKSIRETEALLMDVFNVRLIHALPTKEYRAAILSKYRNKEVDGLKDIIKYTGAYGVLFSEADKVIDLFKLMSSTDDYEGLSESDIAVAATLKAYSLFFSNFVLGGKYGWLLSTFSGDARSIANMIISDEMTKLRSEEIESKKQSKKGGGFGSGGFGEGGFGSGGGFGKGGFR